MTPPLAQTTPPPPESDADDVIIAHAFKWSMVALLIVGGLVGGALWWRSRGGDAPAPILTKDPGAISGLSTPIDLPTVPFRDVTTAAGIDFVHQTGAVGERMLPETMGGGAAFFDVDDDGDQDLLLVSGTFWPWDEHEGPSPTPALYLNDGEGRFTDATTTWGLDKALYGQGVACGDFDNDGAVDLYLTAVGGNRLLRNDGTRFVDVTATAGVAGPPDCWSTSAGFFDADGDGDLDLLVCSYVQWSREVDLELNYTLNGRDRAYGPPTNFKGTHLLLYRNNGDRTFTEVSEVSGLHVANSATGLPVSKALAFVPIDYDRDDDVDLIVANDTTQNFLFQNQGDGIFIDVGPRCGVAFNGMGQSTGAMGVDAAYFRNDDDLAVAIGNFANEMTSFYVKQSGGLQFSDDAIVEGVGSPSRQVLSFGLFFFDSDLDGRLDLLQANGHLEEAINQVQPGQHYRQPPQLFWNTGTSAATQFALLPEGQVGDLSNPMVGRGAAYADIDGDGDLDVVLTEVGAGPRLLRNDQSSGHHWLAVKLFGTVSNRDAIGAWVQCTAGGVTQRRQVMPTRSYLSQVELPVTFGLGEADGIEALTVIWPDGSRQLIPGGSIEIDRQIQVTQATSPAPAQSE